MSMLLENIPLNNPTKAMQEPDLDLDSNSIRSLKVEWGDNPTTKTQNIVRTERPAIKLLY